MIQMIPVIQMTQNTYSQLLKEKYQEKEFLLEKRLETDCVSIIWADYIRTP